MHAGEPEQGVYRFEVPFVLIDALDKLFDFDGGCTSALENPSMAINPEQLSTRVASFFAGRDAKHDKPWQ